MEQTEKNTAPGALLWHGYRIKLTNILSLIVLWLVMFVLTMPSVFCQPAYENPVYHRLKPGTVKGTFSMEGEKVWGGSVICDNNEGKYYMFVSMWPEGKGSWVTHSRVVLAVAERPEGPYEYVKEVLPYRDQNYWDGGMTHNPVIRKHNGTYYLFYTGTTFGFNRQEYVQKDSSFWEAWNNKRIGVATAPHPLGPWKRYDRPVIEPRKGKWDAVITSNAAPVIHDDGSVTLFYKSVQEDWQTISLDEEDPPKFIIGAARADEVFGEYRRLGEEDGIINIEGRHIALEDPTAWHDGTYYHMIVKNFYTQFSDERAAGLYLRSKDGVNWYTPRDEAKAYSRRVTWKEGMTTNQRKLERPQILIEEGRPAYLFFATGFREEYAHHCPPGRRTYNVVMKIQHPTGAGTGH